MIKKNKVIKWFLFISITFYVQSCASQVHYVMDNGRSYKEHGFEYRYSIVPIENTGLEVKVFNKEGSSEGFLTMTRTPFSPIVSSKDSTSDEKIIIVMLTPSFPDGTVLERKTKYDAQFKTENTYFTCANFSEVERKKKRLLLKVEYDVNIRGIITHHVREYDLIRKKSYRVGLH
ncbi:MAG: hypothetical protein JWM14_230 [Chitinophagaceae bacterium]|nr:hypothetical protein [Chitinophagaceae bacterium]